MWAIGVSTHAVLVGVVCGSDAFVQGSVPEGAVAFVAQFLGWKLVLCTLCSLPHPLLKMFKWPLNL